MDLSTDFGRIMVLFGALVALVVIIVIRSLN